MTGEVVTAEVVGKGQTRHIIDRLMRHRLGVIGGTVIVFLYIIVAFAPFIAPNDFMKHNPDRVLAPPTKIRFRHDGKFQLRPFLYAMTRTRDPITLARIYAEDTSQMHPIYFIVRGDRYKLFGFETDIHLFGPDKSSGATLYPLGTDRFGQNLFARMLVGGRVSMTVGIFGILVSFSIGVAMGGVSGYYGGTVDNLIQRLIELLSSFPRIPLWLALSMILPPQWSSVAIYFGVVTVLSLIGWTGLARVVRGQFLSLRQKEFVTAAQALGVSDWVIIWRHILPNAMSYLIVAATLALPGMILGESAISFLGLGIKEPMTSWGLLLKDAQTLDALMLHPWLLMPGLLIVIAVLAFNFFGDALRDAFDPYATR